MTITIYKIERTETFAMYEQGVGYSLKPWGNNTLHYKGSDDGGVKYELPEGYEVEADYFGELHIYNDSGLGCELSVGDNGEPVIIDAVARRAVGLKRAE